MKTQIAVDAGGRVLLPKELRVKLGVGPGDVLEVAESGEQIMLKPVRSTMPLEKKRGFWIYTGQAPAAGQSAAPDFIAADREARAVALLGRARERQ